MHFPRTTALLALIIAFVGTSPSIAPAEEPSTDLTHEVAALFKDPPGITLTDLVVHDGPQGMRVVCGKVNAQPFRILTHRDGRIDTPLSFQVSNDAESARYVVLLCGPDESNYPH
jgi:hypothetical protein